MDSRFGDVELGARDKPGGLQCVRPKRLLLLQSPVGAEQELERRVLGDERPARGGVRGGGAGASELSRRKVNLCGGGRGGVGEAGDGRGGRGHIGRGGTKLDAVREAGWFWG